MSKPIPINIGQKFRRLTVVEVGHVPRRMMICECDCGGKTIVRADALLSGRTGSCGCLCKENRGEIRHGHTRNHRPSIEWISWSNMRHRCLNPNNPSYKNYGGRGIRVCERWLHSFENFLADMGLKPSLRHTIERTNNEKGYEPRNCKWATRTEQVRNTRRNVLNPELVRAIHYLHSEGMSQAAIAELLGKKRGIIHAVVNHKNWKE